MFIDEKRQGEVVAVPLEPWRQQLLAAADLIERDGWWNGSGRRWRNGRWSHCALTALMKVQDSLEAYYALKNAVPGNRVPKWNDCSTEATVVAKMREVAMK